MFASQLYRAQRSVSYVPLLHYYAVSATRQKAFHPNVTATKTQQDKEKLREKEK